MSESNLPEWEQVLSAAAHLQEILPDATLVGGTAVAIFAQHRLSRDADYLDFAALSERIGMDRVKQALDSLDRLYPQASGESALQQLQLQLSNPMPL